jgi:uncharacterized membrane protein YcaP (DUF421 family)
MTYLLSSRNNRSRGLGHNQAAILARHSYAGEIPMTSLTDLFSMDLGLVEAFARGTVVYWVLYLLFRLGGRRNIGSLGFADIVVVILVSEAVGDALSGGSHTLTDGLMVAATIIFWPYLVDRLCYFFPKLDAVMAPSKLCLVQDGKIELRNMRREFVTKAELMEQLRIHGVASVGQVKRAYLESNGEISVVSYEDFGDKGESTFSD